jgi:hypothetical protein
MRFIFGIAILGLLLSTNAYAAKMEEMPKDVTVNSLLKDGWRMYSSDAVAFSRSDGISQLGTYYNLIKGRKVVTCFAALGEVVCYKP